QLVVDPCVDAPAGQVRRLLAIDLGALLVDPEIPVAGATRASVGCDGTLTLLRVDDPVTGKSLTREVDIASSPPNARARLVALAVSELISASWTELATNPTPAVSPAGTPPPPDARRS